MATKAKPAVAAAAVVPAELSVYKDHAMLVLKSTADSKWPFQFGLGKAKLILAHVEAIRAFVASEGKAVE